MVQKMLKLVHLISATLPAIVPLATFFFIRSIDHSVTISRDKWDQEYDYIIVGGGSAGCVLANRLSENRNVKVLLLEAGSSENVVTDFPIAVLNLQNTPIDWGYKTEPQEAACFGIINRRCPWPRGKILGGSSVLNFMMYIRGNPIDYDSWARNGIFGWSWSEVFPYFLKSEDNRDPSIAYNGYHGRGGPLTVQTSKQISPLSQAFVEAGKYLGYPNTDLNGPTQTGFAIPQATIRRGARCSTAKAYLYDIKGRPNLHVVTFAYVTKILFNEHKHAIAVQFDRFSLTYVVHARREILLSAGSINSPQLLMLSGIGPKEQLNSLKIPVIADLPVGHNLQDHIYPGGLHFIINQKLSYLQRRIQTIPQFIRYFKDGTGPLASTGTLEGLGFIKTRYANKSIDYPDFEIHLLCGCLSSDDGKIFRHNVGITEEVWQKVYFPYVNRDCFSLFPVLLRPKSVGYIKLRSSNPYDPPIIEPKYLTHPHDIKTMIDAMRISIKVGLSPPMKKYGSQLLDRVVPGCEGYKLYSDPYLACLARTLTHTIYHPIGTCKMGPAFDPTSVVDPKLRVLGVSRLRVIDGSIIPTLITGNTNAPIIMIAEKTADIIKGVQLPPRSPPYNSYQPFDYLDNNFVERDER